MESFMFDSAAVETYDIFGYAEITGAKVMVICA